MAWVVIDGHGWAEPAAGAGGFAASIVEAGLESEGLLKPQTKASHAMAMTELTAEERRKLIRDIEGAESVRAERTRDVFDAGSNVGAFHEVAPSPVVTITLKLLGKGKRPPPNPHYKPIAAAKQDTFTTDTGEVVVRWPAVLTDADFKDLEGWVDMLKRKIKRSVKESEAEPTTELGISPAPAK